VVTTLQVAAGTGGLFPMAIAVAQIAGDSWRVKGEKQPPPAIRTDGGG